LKAAIDIGTNTIRMLVARNDAGGIRAVARSRRITGMGKELRATGGIGKKEFGKSVSALREFSREMHRLGVVQYRACGTAGLRGAANSKEFLEAAAAAGVRMEIITAAEEARLTWEGVHNSFNEEDGTIVMDIGGGSTEFIAGPGRKDSISLATGVLVVRGLMPVSDPPLPWQIVNLGHYFAERIASGTSSWRNRRFRHMVGTAGTFTTLAALDMKMTEYDPGKIDGKKMSLARLRTWGDRLATMTERQLLSLPGMEKGRERYIVPGVIQVLKAMEHFGMDALVVSDAGLLEGIILGLPN
jgi:exopolyphosphatase/guanosine-5'-triphosphate,3'-diphosphate pyrophosphatase